MNIFAKKPNKSELIKPFQNSEGEERIRHKLLANHSISGDLSLVDIFTKKGKIEVYLKGERLLEQDAQDDDVFFIIQGEVDIITNGQKTAVRDEKTQVGEMAIISRKARSATVKARSSTVVTLRVSGHDFNDAYKNHPEYVKRLSIEAATRNHERISLGKIAKDVTAFWWFLGCLILSIAVGIATFFVADSTEWSTASRVLVSLVFGYLGFLFGAFFYPAYLYRRLIAAMIGAFIGKITIETSLKLQVEGQIGTAYVDFTPSTSTVLGGLITSILFVVIIAILAVLSYHLEKNK